MRAFAVANNLKRAASRVAVATNSSDLEYGAHMAQRYGDQYVIGTVQVTREKIGMQAKVPAPVLCPQQPVALDQT